MPEVSLIFPVCNESGSLEELFSETLQAMASLRLAYEIIFVDDGSTDQSLSIVEKFKADLPGIVKVIALDQRGGQTHALRQGLDAAKGRLVATLDADLQNDPGDIPAMIKKLEEGYDCVCGWRKSRQDTLLKAGMSKFGNLMQRLISGLTIHDVSCTLRIYKQECVPCIPLNWEGQHRFIPLCLSLQGFKVAEIISNHRKRKFGETKYSHKRVLRVVTDFFKILKEKGKK